MSIRFVGYCLHCCHLHTMVNVLGLSRFCSGLQTEIFPVSVLVLKNTSCSIFCRWYKFPPTYEKPKMTDATIIDLFMTASYYYFVYLNFHDNKYYNTCILNVRFGSSVAIMPLYRDNALNLTLLQNSLSCGREDTPTFTCLY